MSADDTQLLAVERAINRQTRALLILVSALRLTDPSRKLAREIAVEIDGEESQVQRTARMAEMLLRAQ